MTMHEIDEEHALSPRACSAGHFAADIHVYIYIYIYISPTDIHSRTLWPPDAPLRPLDNCTKHSATHLESFAHPPVNRALKPGRDVVDMCASPGTFGAATDGDRPWAARVTGRSASRGCSGFFYDPHRRGAQASFVQHVSRGSHVHDCTRLLRRVWRFEHRVLPSEAEAEVEAGGRCCG